MSLVSMIIADRVESATRYYDRWMNLITWGQDKRVRETVLGYIYWIPGRTGIVKELVLGALLSVGLVGWTLARSVPLTSRLAWVLLVIPVYCFIYGYTYQASTPVIYWKRIWK